MRCANIFEILGAICALWIKTFVIKPSWIFMCQKFLLLFLAGLLKMPSAIRPRHSTDGLQLKDWLSISAPSVPCLHRLVIFDSAGPHLCLVGNNCQEYLTLHAITASIRKQAYFHLMDLTFCRHQKAYVDEAYI